MEESALSSRARRTAETSRGLRAVARRLTAERGFGGFTIEELCAEVGVSRRTFFNYFASKENAVMGVTVWSDFTELDEAFVAAGPSASSADLLDAATELAIARWETAGPTIADLEGIRGALERSPQLLAHFVDLATQGERDDIALVERREGWPAGDARAAVLVQVLGAFARPTTLEFFGDGAAEFRTLFTRRVQLARSLFTL
ncbi:TetR/AcrR family transcriptional regulator [Microbacterium sp. CJ88]|uniref:TetR/AcrR family transcriptional regulator n=1 Tax=Microbacterium sp. CJ88 TaxID=3445672 RepID=UPI003F65DE87